MKESGSLWNGYRGLAVRTTDNYANFTGSKFMWLAEPGDLVQLNPVLEEVTEKYGVPHLEKALGRPAAQRVYDQRPINPPKGWRFMPLMMRWGILPEDMKKIEKYRKAANLVETFYTKNGFTRYCNSRGLGHLIPETVIVDDGKLLSQLPFERNWIKRDVEQKLAGVKSVMPIDAKDPNWKTLVSDFLAQDPHSPYQIQKHLGGTESKVTSPCLTFHDWGYEVDFVSDPVIADDHSIGSRIPGKGVAASAQFASELYQALYEDGYMYALNTDIVWDANHGHSMIEYNMRYGGSHIPWFIMKRLGAENAYYERECPVAANLSVESAFHILECHGVYAFRWGDMAQPDPKQRHIGLVAIGDDAVTTLRATKAELQQR